VGENSDTDVGIMSEQARIEIFDEIRETLQRIVREQLEDLSFVEIMTAESDNINAKINPNYENFLVALTAKSGNPLRLKPKAGGEAKEATITKKEDGELKGKVLARTRIELDGDIALILPTNRNEIDAEVLQLHKTNVDVAVQNYRLFVNAIFDVLKIAVNLTQR
jgi:hypothetical protein